MWSITAVRTSGHDTTCACGAARATVASGAAIRQTCADAACDVNVSSTVIVVRALSLGAEKLALEDLTSTADRTEWISVDDEQRRIRRHQVTAARTDFIGQRF